MATDGTPRLWWLAADDVAGLLARLDALASGDRGPDDPDGSDPPPGDGPVRLGIVDPDDRKLRLARRLVAKGQPWRTGRSDIWFSPDGLVDGGGKVAFLFPGVEPTFAAEATDLPGLGRRLGLEAPVMEDDTIPHRSRSIYRLGIFLDEALRRLGVEPDLIAGHSIGEWSGTVASGIVPRDHADELVSFIDVENVLLPDVDFAALATGVDTVETAIAGIDGVVVSHDNCPGQSVICGPPDRVDEALDRLRQASVLGYKLDFQSGFHTPVIAPAIEGIRALVGGLPFGPGAIPLWSSTIGAPYPGTHDEIVDLHLRHLVEPVRFRPLIERLHRDAGVRVFVQVGLGSLTGFVNDTLAGHAHLCVPLLVAKRSALAQVHRALTALWVEGLAVRPDALRGTSPPEPAPIAAAAPAAPSHMAPAAPSPAAEPAPSAFPSAAAAPSPPPAPPGPAASPQPEVPVGVPQPVGTGPSYALVAAVEMVHSATRAGQDVIEALAARLGLPATGAPTAPAPTAVAVAPAPATAPTPAAPATPTAPAPATPAASATPAAAAPATAAAPPPASAPPAADRPAPAVRRPWPTGPETIVRHLSIEDLPETVDHTLYKQPDGWPDVSDMFPIVAMTSQMAILREVAAEYAGDRQVIDVAVRNMRWLDLSDPLDVRISVAPKGDDTLSLVMGNFCRATIKLGEFPPAPRYEPTPLTNPRAPTHTAQDLWDMRLMFHGPRFQGIDEMGPVGDDGILGVFRKLDTPGILLDNLGKLIAYMAIDKNGIGEGALPLGSEVELFGPTPPVGTEVRCDVRVTELEPDVIWATGQLVLPDGTVWCRVRRWASLIFHLDEVMEPLYHVPDRHVAVEPQPGGWNLLLERWPMGAARELTARRFMARPEREAFQAMNLLDQRRWLLQVVAVKDTVRHWLQEDHGIACYPVEVQVVPDGEGRFRVECPLIPEGHDPRVSVALLEWLAVSVLGDGGYRDIEARLVDDGEDPNTVAAELAATVQGRNGGGPVGSSTGPVQVLPSRVSTGPPPRFAVAWTEGRAAAAPAQAPGQVAVDMPPSTGITAPVR